MVHSIYIKFFLAAPAILILLLINATAQNKQPSKPIVVGENRGIDGSECNITKADFDLIAEALGEEGLIIAIARRGKGEFSRSTVQHRLQNLRDYLRYTRGISEERIVTAEGERVRGLGQVEVYIGGRLFMVFHMKLNRDFLSGCKT